VFVTGLLFGVPGAAVAAPPPELVDVLGHFVRAVSGTDADDFARLFAAEPSITDTVYPYHWQGKDAATRYFADLQGDIKADGWSGLNLSNDGDPFLVVRPGFAYAALHLFVDYKVHGTAHRDAGMFTLSVARDGAQEGAESGSKSSGKWKITSATWSYTRPPGR
jgi:hypothetical protein